MKDTKELNELIKACAQNSEKAQFELFKRFYGKMHFVCKTYFKDEDTAKEMVQEGFIKIFDKLNLFDFSGSFEAWIKRIMVNNCIDQIRKNKRTQFVSVEDFNELSNEEEDSEILVDDFYTPEMALNCLNQLSPAYKTVFNLFYIEQYSHKEIAEKLNISEGTSKSNLAKAKARLRELIEKTYSKK